MDSRFQGPDAMDYSIFRAYDIRGLYSRRNQSGCLLRHRAGYCQVFNPASVAIGMDVRLSSEPLKEAWPRGITEAGADVIDHGKVTTDSVYYAVGGLRLLRRHCHFRLP
jgi:phosphomannomutase